MDLLDLFERECREYADDLRFALPPTQILSDDVRLLPVLDSVQRPLSSETWSYLKEMEDYGCRAEPEIKVLRFEMPQRQDGQTDAHEISTEATKRNSIIATSSSMPPHAGKANRLSSSKRPRPVKSSDVGSEARCFEAWIGVKYTEPDETTNSSGSKSGSLKQPAMLPSSWSGEGPSVNQVLRWRSSGGPAMEGRGEGASSSSATPGPVLSQDPFLAEMWPPWVRERVSTLRRPSVVPTVPQSAPPRTGTLPAAPSVPSVSSVVWWVNGARRLGDNCSLSLARWLSFRCNCPLLALVVIHPSTHAVGIGESVASDDASGIFQGRGAALYSSALLELRGSLERINVPLVGLVADPRQVISLPFIMSHLFRLSLFY